MFPLLFSAGNFAVYVRRARVYTKLTARGIEVHRFVRTFVPWENITNIETLNYERDHEIPVATRLGPGMVPRMSPGQPSADVGGRGSRQAAPSRSPAPAATA